MFAPVSYLQWARRFHGSVRYDLAPSGVPPIELADFDTGSLESLSSAAEARDRLIAAIARYNGVRIEETVPSLGTTQALWLAYSSIAQPGDEVLIESPAYEPLAAIAMGMDLRVRRFTRPESKRFALEPDRVASSLSERTRAVVLTSLHNPSGNRATDDEIRAIAQAARSRNALVIVDEVYAPFDAFVDEHGVFGRSARRLAPNVVAVSSLTKCYGVGQERVGWMLAPPELIRRAEDVLTATAGSLPLSHARQGLRAFAHIHALAERSRGIVAGKRRLVADWATAHGWGWSAPSDGLFGFVSLSDRGDVTPLIEKIARESSVLVTPGAFFGAPSGFRIAWPGSEADLKVALDRLAQSLRH